MSRHRFGHTAGFEKKARAAARQEARRRKQELRAQKYFLLEGGTARPFGSLKALLDTAKEEGKIIRKTSESEYTVVGKVESRPNLGVGAEDIVGGDYYEAMKNFGGDDQ